MRVTRSQAMAAAVEALEVAGVPLAHATIQADLLVDAEVRGLPSHGLMRLPRVVQRIANGVADPTSTGNHRWSGEALLEVDGGNGLGPVVTLTALDAVQKRARETGVACAAISSSNHLGALGWYVRKVAEGGQVCIAMTTAEAIMHPFGGTQALVGSNPVAIGVPATPHPLVFDMATTVVSMGKVHDYANRGQALDGGWALDSDGNPTTNAVSAKAGAIAPFGGAKGYGLGVAIETLVATLTGTSLGTDVVGTLDSVNESTKGDVFIVINGSSGRTETSVSAFLEDIRNSRRVEVDVPVTVPGDRSEARRRAAEAVGFDVPRDIWNAILQYARQD